MQPVCLNLKKKKKKLEKKRQTLTTERGSFITDLSALLEN